MVAAVVMVFVFIFCTVLLFHLVQQNRYNTATQLESIARSVREPLSNTILKGDIPEAEAILRSIRPAGVVSRCRCGEVPEADEGAGRTPADRRRI